MSCPHPPAISGGTSEVVNDVATYTCNTGYKINGSPQIGCYNGQWSSPLPECSLINSANQYWLDITNNQDEIPVWLIAMVGLAAVLAVILLLACLAAVLWKLFGSPKVAPNLMIDHTGGGAGKGCSCCYRYAGCCRRKRPRNEQKVASNGVTSMSDKMNIVQETPTKNQAISQMFEVKDNNNSNMKQHVETQTRGWAIVQEYFHQVKKCNRRQETTTTFDSTLPVRDLLIVERRRQKVVPRRIWLPHTHEIRNINTSTK